MEKEIIGFKLIKRYPGSYEIGWEARTKSAGIKASWFAPGISRYISEEELLTTYKEFYEPIYKEIGVDLNTIYEEVFLRKAPNVNFSSPTLTVRDTTLEMMKEACRKTLELVKQHLRQHKVAGYCYMTEDHIDKIFKNIE